VGEVFFGEVCLLAIVVRVDEHTRRRREKGSTAASATLPANGSLLFFT
jgi:hypothetical protein